MTHTAKACPGCGESPGYRFRESTEVCGNCKQRLKDAAEIIAGFAKRTDTELRRGPFAPHGLPYIYRRRLNGASRNSNDRNGNEAFRKVVDALITLVGQPADAGSFFNSVESVVTGMEGSSGQRIIFRKGSVRHSTNYSRPCS